MLKVNKSNIMGTHIEIKTELLLLSPHDIFSLYCVTHHITAGSVFL